MSEMLPTQEYISPLADEDLPPLHTSEYLERAQTLEEFVSTYSQLMDSTVANHEAAFDSLQSLPDRASTHLFDTTDADVYARERLDTTLQLTTDEVTDIMDGAARVAKKFLTPEDALLLLYAESSAQIPSSTGWNSRNQSLDQASSPLARQAIKIALDAQQLRKARDARFDDFTSDRVLKYINQEIDQASSPAAQQAIRAAMDGDILKETRIIRSSWLKGANYTENALSRLFNQTSSPTVRLVIAERAEAAAKGMWDLKSPTKKSRPENAIFGEGVSAGRFIFDLFSDYENPQGFTDTTPQTSTNEPYGHQPSDDSAEDGNKSEGDKPFDFEASFGERHERKRQKEEKSAHKNRDDYYMDEAPKVEVDSEVQQTVNQVVHNNRQYGWLASEDPGLVRQVIDDIKARRAEDPDITDREIYLDARRKIDRGEQNGESLADDKDMATYHVLDAMMGGDVRGTLPIEKDREDAKTSAAS